MKKIIIFNRDGILIDDQLKKLKVLDGVLDDLQELQKLGYQLVMIVNQQDSHTQKNFDAVQNQIFEILHNEKIKFEKVFVFPKDNIASIIDFLKEKSADYNTSLMIGDKEIDRQFAENIGIRFLKTKSNGHFPKII